MASDSGDHGCSLGLTRDPDVIQMRSKCPSAGFLGATILEPAAARRHLW